VTRFSISSSCWARLMIASLRWRLRSEIWVLVRRGWRFIVEVEGEGRSVGRRLNVRV
jgi:hypothetical protein